MHWVAVVVVAYDDYKFRLGGKETQKLKEFYWLLYNRVCFKIDKFRLEIERLSPNFTFFCAVN